MVQDIKQYRIPNEDLKGKNDSPGFFKALLCMFDHTVLSLILCPPPLNKPGRQPTDTRFNEIQVGSSEKFPFSTFLHLNQGEGTGAFPIARLV